VKVVAVVNYKGGVGKTTMTANIGAGLAARGKKVLLIDLDPQASLTFSFVSQDQWLDEMSDKRTIKQWYDSSDNGRTATRLAELLMTPSRVNQLLAGTGGWLDLIASHLDLVSVESLLSGALDAKPGQVSASRFLQVYRRLAEGLTDKAFATYDVILIDCPPNFNMMTRNAIVASDFLLIPTRPDFLSTNGINHLGRQVLELVDDYNNHAREARGRHRTVSTMAMPAAAVVFTMVQYYNNEPMAALSTYISRVKALRVPTFATLVRDRKSLFAVAPEYGVPAILATASHRDTCQELHQLVDEFAFWIGGT
jgi:chromosome partitioning protein